MTPLAVFGVAFGYLAYEDWSFSYVSAVGLIFFCSTACCLCPQGDLGIGAVFFLCVMIGQQIFKRKWNFADLILYLTLVSIEPFEVFMRICCLALAVGGVFRLKTEYIPLYPCFFMGWLSTVISI